jgi:hypothetical protein
MPLRSASEFPITPDPEALEGTYQDCRAALVSANRSRGVLKAQSDRRGVVITELQRELVELEMDLADEARAKARLHALNAKLGTVIRELEETGDAMVGLIDESERQSGFWLVEMFRRLIEQATRWRTVKAKAAALAAEAAEECPASSPLAVGDKQVGRFGWPDLPLNSFLSRAVRGAPGGRPWRQPQRRRHEIWSTRSVQPRQGQRFGDRHRTTIALAAPSGLFSIASAPD